MTPGSTCRHAILVIHAATIGRCFVVRNRTFRTSTESPYTEMSMALIGREPPVRYLKFVQYIEDFLLPKRQLQASTLACFMQTKTARAPRSCCAAATNLNRALALLRPDFTGSIRCKVRTRARAPFRTHSVAASDRRGAGGLAFASHYEILDGRIPWHEISRLCNHSCRNASAIHRGEPGIAGSRLLAGDRLASGYALRAISVRRPTTSGSRFRLRA